MHSHHDTDAQKLFEKLRIAARERDKGDTLPFINHQNEIITLNQRQLSDLIDIIVVTPDRQHFLAHLVEADIKFDPYILEDIAKKATDWQDTLTQSAVTLMLLGAKWSTDHDIKCFPRSKISYVEAEVDEYKFYVRQEDSEVNIQPYAHSINYTRNKMHMLFHSNQKTIHKIWDYAHNLYLYCCEKGLKKSIEAMLLFKWPAKFSFSSIQKTIPIQTLFLPNSSKSNTLPSVPYTPQTSTINQQQNSESEFVTFPEVNRQPLVIPNSKPIHPEISLAAEIKEYDAWLDSGISKIIPNPGKQFIDVNYKNQYGENAIELARNNNHFILADFLNSQGVRIDSPDKSDNRIGKIITSIKFKNFILFQKTVDNDFSLITEIFNIFQNYKIKCKNNPFFAAKYEEYIKTLREYEERMIAAENQVIPLNNQSNAAAPAPVSPVPVSPRMFGPPQQRMEDTPQLNSVAAPLIKETSKSTCALL